MKLQQALAAEGVVTVWANGNDGGDGSESLSNPPGMDPTGGVISVASYNDLGTGTRDGEVSEFSSRGQAGDLSSYSSMAGDRCVDLGLGAERRRPDETERGDRLGLARQHCPGLVRSG